MPMIIRSLHLAFSGRRTACCGAAVSIAMVLLLPLSTQAAGPPTQTRPKPLDLKLIDPRALVQHALANEAEMLDHQGSYLRYQMHRVDQKGDVLRDVIETRDGTVARLRARDGKPLTQEQDQAERDRLNGLLEHPDEFARHHKRDQAEKDRARDLVKQAPDAFLYSFVNPQSPAPGSAPGQQQVEIEFKPSPSFKAANIEGELLHSIEGHIWIDPAQQQIVRLEIHVAEDVALGWGLLARVYKGGTLTLQQTPVDQQRWMMTQMDEHVTGKALMVKNINISGKQEAANFQPVPGSLTYQDAIKLLLNH